MTAKCYEVVATGHSSDTSDGMPSHREVARHLGVDPDAIYPSREAAEVAASGWSTPDDDGWHVHTEVRELSLHDLAEEVRLEASDFLRGAECAVENPRRYSTASVARANAECFSRLAERLGRFAECVSRHRAGE